MTRFIVKRNKDILVSFYDIKGMVEDIYAKLNVPARDYQEIQHPFLCQCTHIIIDKHCIGIIGTVHPKILEYFDLKMDIYYCEMSVDCITKMINEKKVFSHYYNFPSSHRDLSIVIENRIKAQDITHVIQSCNRGMIKDILLYDQFMGKQIPKGHKSLTFSIEYQASDRTLSSEEIEAHHATIVSNLKKMFNAKLRD